MDGQFCHTQSQRDFFHFFLRFGSLSFFTNVNGHEGKTETLIEDGVRVDFLKTVLFTMLMCLVSNECPNSILPSGFHVLLVGNGEGT